MALTSLQYCFGIASGVLVGFSLGLVGGGGSILAVPLIIYFVGVKDPHLAIGTTAVAVAANAVVNLANHTRSGTVKWRCAATFAIAGVAGALFGSTLGKSIDGQKLLVLFALLMVIIGLLMLRRREGEGFAEVSLTYANAPKLIGAGAVTGALSGFFGIGGGFLIVPGLMMSTGMPILYAVGSSLLAVAAFGITTAANYAISGWVDWALAVAFIGGGIVGGIGGAASARHLAQKRGALNTVFALLIFVVAGYILYRSRSAI